MTRSFLLFLLAIILAPLTTTATGRFGTPKAPRKVTQRVVPEGTPQWYTMDAYIQTGQGSVMYYGLSNQLSFSPDGKSVYFRTLFPAQYGELWVKGTINGNTVTIDHNTVIGTEVVTFEEGTVTLEYKVGEPVFDLAENLVDMKDVVFKIDGDRIYIEDDQKNPDHAIALYALEDDEPDLYDWTFCDSFKPYTGSTEMVTPPANAEVKSYVYHYKDLKLNDATDIKRIAVDGNTYYFEGLVPSVGGWTKGTRSGNTISVSRAQLLAFDPQILKIAGYRTTDGGRLSDFSFTIDNDGVITQDDGNNQFIVCYQTNGTLLDYGRNFKMTPYDATMAFSPMAPYEVHSVYYSELHQHGIEFYQAAYAEDGSQISPEQLGYYIYVNSQRFTFTKKQYPYLSWNETQFIPYGYCDDKDLGDIYNDGIYNVVLFYISDYETLGVQSVYRTGDKEILSDLINVTKANNVEVVPSAIASPELLPETRNHNVYDLYGRFATPSAHGVHIVNGKKVIK